MPLKSDKMSASDSFIDYLVTPLGEMEICCTGKNVTWVSFPADVIENKKPVNKNEITEKCVVQLNQYFLGALKIFDLPLQQTGTEFQQKVWKALIEIQFGITTSYLKLSQKLGDEKAIRAVATANGANNIAIIVPCHRVIGTNGSLTGYAGGLWRKQWLLDHEAKQIGTFNRLF
jgi:methylated-DNA-[protein]-cysteine S-methyltransferase